MELQNRCWINSIDIMILAIMSCILHDRDWVWIESIEQLSIVAQSISEYNFGVPFIQAVSRWLDITRLVLKLLEIISQNLLIIAMRVYCMLY